MIKLSVSSCHSRPKQLWKRSKDKKEEWERQFFFFSPNGKHTEHCFKNVSFICFLPAPFCFGLFFCFIVEDSNPGRLEVSPSCGKSGGSYQIMLQLSHAKSTESENIYSTPPCHRSRGKGIQPVGRGHSSLPQRDSPATPSKRKGWACWYGSLGPQLWICSLLFVAFYYVFIWCYL